MKLLRVFFIVMQLISLDLEEDWVISKEEMGKGRPSLIDVNWIPIEYVYLMVNHPRKDFHAHDEHLR